MTPKYAIRFVAPSRDRRKGAAIALSATLVALSLAGCAMDAGSDDVSAEPVSAGARLLKAARAPGAQWQRLHIDSAAAQHLTVSRDENGNVVTSCKRTPTKAESSKP